MEFSSLVLMEKDKVTNMLVREMGSYEVGEGAEFITKMFYDGDKVNIYFDTCTDVNEWEFTAIFDVFQLEAFEEKGIDIETEDDEYNPTWLVKFDFSEDYDTMRDKIQELCILIKENMELAFSEIKEHEEEYK